MPGSNPGATTTINLKITTEQRKEWAARLERAKPRHDALAEATVKVLREAGEERIKRENEKRISITNKFGE